jgi:hypothetical protein
MKSTLFLLVVLLSFVHCREKGGSDPAKDDQDLMSTTDLQIKPTTASVYQNIQNREKALSPVGRLCAESKGYRKDEWDALNECSWAVEKYQMDLHPGIVSRVGGQLTIQLADSSIVLTHQPDEFYQFVSYLSNSKHFVIRVLRPASCPEYWLYDQRTKSKIILSGEPVFTEDKNSFLVSSSSSNPKLNCPPKLSLWNLQQGAYVEARTMKIKNAIIDLMWYNGNNWVGKQGEDFLEIGL